VEREREKGKNIETKEITMRILITDDTNENLEAARQAAKGFPEHEFVFSNSAKETVALLNTVDAVITDLFFPDENHYGTDLGDAYESYCLEVRPSDIYEKVVEGYYSRDRDRANEALNNAIDLLCDGTIRGAIEGWINYYEHGRYADKERADEYRERLKSLPAPQFPYGAAVMLLAKELGKRHCLVSNIHSHQLECKDAASAIDGMILLLPLMSSNIISIEEARCDGDGSLTYIGGDEVYRRTKQRSKNNPAVWAEAIRRILAQ